MLIKKADYNEKTIETLDLVQEKAISGFLLVEMKCKHVRKCSMYLKALESNLSCAWMYFTKKNLGTYFFIQIRDEIKN